jgi:hypothetical protein
MITLTSSVSRRRMSAFRFSRFTPSVTNLTFVAPLPISAARAILGRPASRPLVFPMLFGMSTPPGAGPATMRYIDAVLGLLREGGFTIAQAHHALHILDGLERLQDRSP